MEHTLLEILEAREQRVLRQQELLSAFYLPLISFTLNIPGPDKSGPLAEKAFYLGCRLLQGQLKAYKTAHFEQRCTAAGWEAFFCVEASEETLKQIAVFLEDKTPGGRVFDMDVLTPAGQKLDRAALGAPRRKCLLCDADAALCGRSRAHSLDALQSKTNALMETLICEEIAKLAVQSLLCEVYATPKPGLVDQNNNGSHKDMDLMLFLRSSAVLWRYFRSCAISGLRGGEPAAVFEKLRQAGLEAEQVMYRATGGINTHKGAIFSLGILCGAAAMLSARQWEDPAVISRQAASLAKGIVRKDYEFMETPATAGEQLFERYGITGARGQAEAGFPAAFRVGLPVLERAMAQELSFNDALCVTLLHIIATTWDTNLIKRGGMAAYGQIQAMLQTLLRADPYPPREILEDLDRAFIKQNLSPGGSADLLSATCFAYFLKHP